MDDIRCALNDAEYHELYGALSECLFVTSTLKKLAAERCEEDESDTGDALVGLAILSERLKKSQALMEAHWEKTVERGKEQAASKPDPGEQRPAAG